MCVVRVACVHVRVCACAVVVGVMGVVRVFVVHARVRACVVGTRGFCVPVWVVVGVRVCVRGAGCVRACARVFACAVVVVGVVCVVRACVSCMRARVVACVRATGLCVSAWVCGRWGAGLCVVRVACVHVRVCSRVW